MSLRIGYFANSKDLSATVDRRRLPYWAKARGHILLIDQSENVDVIVYTDGGSFTPPKRDGIPIIFDMPDTYYLRSNFIEDFSRMSLKFFEGKVERAGLSFRHFLRHWIKNADCIVTSNHDVSLDSFGDNLNVVQILDFHEEIAERPIHYYTRCPRKLVWEGMPSSLPSLFQQLKSHTNCVETFFDSIEIITDEYQYLLSRRFLPVRVQHIYKNRLGDSLININFHKWTVEELDSQAEKHPISFIPINLKDVIASGKPENRVLISWRLGLPVVASSTAANVRLQDKVDSKFTYTNVESLRSLFSSFFIDPQKLTQQIEEGKDYLKSYHSREILLRKWDSAVLGLI